MAGITRGGSGPQRTMLPSQELLDDLCRYWGFRFLSPFFVWKRDIAKKAMVMWFSLKFRPWPWPWRG
jgi:hypothetical protein